MFVASYRNTERGMQARMAEKLAIEHAERDAQRREAWEAEKRRVAAMEAELQQYRILVAKWKIEQRLQEGRYRHTLKDIERRACRVFKLTPCELRSDRRSRDLVFARQFVMYWAARLSMLSYPQIGKRLGGRDHTTTLHGAKVYPVKRAAQGRTLRKAR